MKQIIYIIIFILLSNTKVYANAEIIFSVFHFADKVTAWIGIVESSEQKLDRIINSHLEGAKGNLKQAISVTKKDLKHKLIADTIGRLNQAVALHDNSQKAVELLSKTTALTGLYICYMELKEEKTATMMLESISKLSITRDSWERDDSLSPGYWLVDVGRVIQYFRMKEIDKDYKLYLSLRTQAIQRLKLIERTRELSISSFPF